MIYIVMGVSGSGKSTFSRLLADAVQIPFIDADDIHPQENIDKMGRGEPLTDEDRYLWLKRLSVILHEHEEDGVVLACSALKESYREILRSKLNSICVLIYLSGSIGTVTSMISSRSGHFFSAEMLPSQFATLEEPEDAMIIDLDSRPDFSEIIKERFSDLSLDPDVTS